jgi:hypothetical protein
MVLKVSFDVTLVWAQAGPAAANRNPARKALGRKDPGRKDLKRRLRSMLWRHDISTISMQMRRNQC